MAANYLRPGWRTSSYSSTAGGQCVEVEILTRSVRVRDSTLTRGIVGADGTTGTPLTLSRSAWAELIAVITRGAL